MSFGIWESLASSEAEGHLARQASVDKMSAAIYDVREKLGPVLFASKSVEEFRHKVAMMKNDQSLYRVIDAHLTPVSSVVRRIVGKSSILEKEFKAVLAAGDPLNPGHHESPSVDRPPAQGAPHHQAPGFLSGHPHLEKGWDALIAEPGGHSVASRQADFAGDMTGLKSSWQPEDLPTKKELDPSSEPFDKYLKRVDNTSKKVDRNFTSAVLTLYSDWAQTAGLNPRKQATLIQYAQGNRALYQKVAREIQAWDFEHKPSAPKGQSKTKLKDVTAGQRTAYDPDKSWGGDPDYAHIDTNDPSTWGGDEHSITNPETGDTLHYNNPHTKALQERLKGGESIEGREARQRRADIGNIPEANGSMGPELGGTNGLSEHDNAGLSRIEMGHPGMSAWADNAPEKEMPITGSRDPMRKYIAWCTKNGYKRLSARNIDIYSRGNPKLAMHLAKRSLNAIHVARQRIAEDEGSDPDDGFGGKKAPPFGKKDSRRNQAGQHGLDTADYGEPITNPYTGDSNSLTDGEMTPEGLPGWKKPASRRRQAAPDYLNKAQDALTQLLNQKAEEFQETIAPLQQALVTVQQATQLQQSQNPMNVLPPPGTVNVMPGGDQGPVGMPAPGAQDLGAAAQALSGPLGGGGAPPPPGGAPPPGGGGSGDPSAPPPAAAGGGLPPDLSQQAGQQATARKRGGSGKARGATRPHRQGRTRSDSWDPFAYEGDDGGYYRDDPDPVINKGKKPPSSMLDKGADSDEYGHYQDFLQKRGGVADLWNKWTQTNTGIGGDPDYEAFAQQFGVGQRALHKLKMQHGVVDTNAPATGIAAKRKRTDISRRKVATEQPNHVEVAVKAQWEKMNSHMGMLGYKWDKGLNQWTKPGQHSVKNFWQHTGKSDHYRDPTGYYNEDGMHYEAPGQRRLDPYESTPEHPGLDGRPGGTMDPEWLKAGPSHDHVNVNPNQGRLGSGQQADVVNRFHDWLASHGHDEINAPGPEEVAAYAHSGVAGPDDISALRQLIGSRKQAWTGWGPSVFPKTRQVHGWDWDNHLNGYHASTPRHFECACGEPFPAPSGFHRCACGKQWNSYVIGTGGNNHEASAEKFFVREIPTRPDVIMANRQMEAASGHRPIFAPNDYSGQPIGYEDDHTNPEGAEAYRHRDELEDRAVSEYSASVQLVDPRTGKLHTLVDPGEVYADDGEDPGHSTFKKPPNDWAKRGPGSKWQKSPIGK